MKNLDLLKEVAALGGYDITGTSQQSITNKERAQRRINTVRADIASRFSGRWASLYREGWLPLVPVYGTGTVTVTLDSRTVTGSGTTFTSAMVGRKFLGPDSAYYKIASFVSATEVTLSEPYQGTTASGGSYQIWKDEYVLYPDAFSITDFVNYIDPTQMMEQTTKNSRLLGPRNTANDTPRYWTLVGRQRVSTEYSTGTVSISLNSRTLTGVGTSWLGNVYPGYEVIIGTYKYHVESVNSDTSITLYEYASVVVAGATYTSTGRNALVVRFTSPSSQTVVNYGYYSKSYSLVNDNDEDWMEELYPHVLIAGVMKYDFLDKNDPTRASLSAQMFDNDVHNAHQADTSQFGGIISVGLDIPDSARL